MLCKTEQKLLNILKLEKFIVTFLFYFAVKFDHNPLIVVGFI